MEAKEKAKELVNKFLEIDFQIVSGEFVGYLTLDLFDAKQCALISVNEILNEFPNGIEGSFEEKRKHYWVEVKQEIEKS